MTLMPQWITGALAYLYGLLPSAQFWLGALVLTVVFAILNLRRFQSESVSIGLPFGLGSATYKTTPQDRVVAWKLYVQLVTRKAALPFDEQYDLISDVYDSLFELFQITRDLLLELPLREFQRTEGVASLLIRVLNDGVRPHLTRWQADFRKWLKDTEASPDSSGMTPQELQQQYPRYAELVSDLKRTNTELSKFTDELRDIARSTKRKRRKPTKVLPAPPTTGEPAAQGGSPTHHSKLKRFLRR